MTPSMKPVSNGFDFYKGSGATLQSRGRSFPLFDESVRTEEPSGYLADEPLRSAVNVALALGQPLLITGEPGTGKTQLASSVAWELGLPGPLEFRTRTTSAATDLFYTYDALRHFHDAHHRQERVDPENYITYQPLGLAILLSLASAEADSFLPPHLKGRGPTRSVVLIDEVDKAPRDLPNDILGEIETMSFVVRETGRGFQAGTAYRPVLILTSNSEKNLPDAFLRRCVFYHIEFPGPERLAAIVERRLKPNPEFTPSMLKHALEHFNEIRELALRKKPATAELLAWIRVLERLSIDVRDVRPGQTEALALSYSVLAKTQEDLAKLRRTFAG